MKTNINVKAIEVNIENAIKIQQTVSGIPNTEPPVTYVENNKIVCDSNTDFEKSNEEIKDTIEENLLYDEDITAYETKCHKCDHDEIDRKKSGGCYGLTTVSSKGEMPPDDPIG